MRKVTKHWQTRDGGKIRICDMSDKHLLNAMNCIDRAHDRAIQAAETVSAILDPDSEASFIVDQQIAGMEAEDPADHFPILDDLRREASRRGLKF